MTLDELKFKPEDFSSYDDDADWAQMSAIANRILEEKLKRAPEVYAHDDIPPIWGTLWTMKPAEQLGIKLHHKARLVCIEKLEEK